jgi:hypothetical protein
VAPFLKRMKINLALFHNDDFAINNYILSQPSYLSSSGNYV